MKYYTTEIGNFVLMSETKLILIIILSIALTAFVMWFVGLIIRNQDKKHEYMKTLGDDEYRKYNEYLKTL